MTILETIFESGLTIVMLLLTIIISVGLVAAIFLYIRYLRKYLQFKIVIWEKDGFGQLKQTHDNAGIFVDSKTKNKRLFLKKNKVGLNPDSIPYIQSMKSKTIYFYKTGLKNFHYLKINIDQPKLNLEVGEEDVNWGINAYDRSKKIFGTGWFQQLLPFLTLAFVSIMILVIFIYFFKNFGTLANMANGMDSAASKMADLAMALRNGTVVLPA